MAEPGAHKRTKRRSAGKHGETEVPLPGGRRLGALTSGGGRATEVERSGKLGRLEEAADRLKESGASQRVMRVPQHHMSAAVEAMKRAGVSGTVTNLGRMQRRSIPKR